MLNNLGVVQLRRGGTPQTGLPTYYFNKAAEADPGRSRLLLQSRLRLLAATAIRRRRSTGCARRCAAIPPTATRISCSARRSPPPGNATEAAREKELARRLSSTYEEWDKRPAATRCPKGLERVKNDVELPHARRIETTTRRRREQRDQQELAPFYLDRGRRLFQQENDRDAVAELNRALYLSPYLADAHLLLGRIHLRNGRVREAIDAFKISLWSAETAEAHAALGEAYRQAEGSRRPRAPKPNARSRSIRRRPTPGTARSTTQARR